MPLNKDTSKQWFEKGDKPTAAQFAQVFEWLRWKDEPITVAEIEGLIDILNGKADISDLDGISSGDRVQKINMDEISEGILTLEQGWLYEKVIIKTLTDASVAIGTEAEVDDILPFMDIASNLAHVFTVDKLSVVDFNWYFRGLPAGSTVYLISKFIDSFALPL